MPVNESEGDRVGGEPSFRLLAGNTISAGGGASTNQSGWCMGLGIEGTGLVQHGRTTGRRGNGNALQAPVSFLPLPARGLRSKTVELRCNSGEDDTASRASKLCDKHMGDVDSGPDVSILLGMGRAGEGEQPVLSCLRTNKQQQDLQSECISKRTECGKQSQAWPTWIVPQASNLVPNKQTTMFMKARSQESQEGRAKEKRTDTA